MGFFSPSSWQLKEKQLTTIAKCGQCGLGKKCFSPRMGVTGRGDRKVLFVAEAPGEQEDRQGTQLVGEAGQCLREILKGLKFDLDGGWKTNAVICRPPENKMTPLYIECCRPFLLEAVRKLEPKVVVLLGGSAVESLIAPIWRKDLGPLERWVGWTIPSRTFNTWICPTYHPSYILRLGEDALMVKIVRDHLEAALKLEKVGRNYPTLEELKAQVEVITSDRLARLRLRDLATKEGQLAFDYETTGLKPERAEQRIVSVSFSLDGRDTFACRMAPDTAKLVSVVLRQQKLAKIASNIKFEDRWTRVKLGHPVVNWHWDTMMAAHALDNRPGITSIKFQAFVHFGIADYNSGVEDFLRADTANSLNRIDELDEKDLLMYNGLDSLLEYMVAQKQMEML